ncbi:hypothetical protein FCV25MIE_24834 [Fagus crenata]
MPLSLRCSTLRVSALACRVAKIKRNATQSARRRRTSIRARTRTRIPGLSPGGDAFAIGSCGWWCVVVFVRFRLWVSENVGLSSGGDASSFLLDFNDGFRKMLGRLPVVIRLQLVRVDGVRRRFRSISMMGFGKCWVVSRW